MTCAICNVEVSDHPSYWRGQPMCLTCMAAEHRRIELEGLRDEFAVAALTGLCSIPGASPSADLVAIASYKIADAMLKAREEKS